MTRETKQLAEKIKQAAQEQSQETEARELQSGYNTTLNLLTDLFGCVLIGLALGLAVYHYWHASVLWVAGLTILGGIAGLWTVARYAVGLDKKDKK